jgi:concentrative nucleoside transporter, CNT family
MSYLLPSICILILIGISVLFSRDRRNIDWKLISIGLLLNVVIALLVLKFPPTRAFFSYMGHLVNKLLDFSLDGATFLFGPEFVTGRYIFAVRIFAAITFVSALTSVAYYLGFMERLIRFLANILVRTMKLSAPESLSCAAAVFVGQVECQLLIKPYISRLSSSELFTSITASMATISGSALISYAALGMNTEWLIAASIMSIPAGILIAKILVPETDASVIEGKVDLHVKKEASGFFDAVAVGAMAGAQIAMNVLVMVLVAIAMMALLNGIVSLPLHRTGFDLQIQDMLGYLLTPLAFLMGVPWHEAFHVGRLMATEILLNEYVSYGELAGVIQGHGAYVLSAKTQLIATVALCGFANLGSVAITIGGLSAMSPERRREITTISFPAMIGANIATWITAAICGMIY